MSGYSRNKKRMEDLCAEAGYRSMKAGQSGKAAYHATKKAVRQRAKEVGMDAALSEAEGGMEQAALVNAMRLARH